MEAVVPPVVERRGASSRRPANPPKRRPQAALSDSISWPEGVTLTEPVIREASTRTNVAAPVVLHLRAIDNTGLPLAGQVVGVSVDLFQVPEHGLTSHPPFPSAAPPGHRGGAVRETESNGHVSVTLKRELFPDRINVIRVRNEDDSLATIRKAVVVPTNGIIDLGDVRLLRPSQRFPATIASGTILDHAGQPIHAVSGHVDTTLIAALIQDFDVEIASGTAIVDPVVLMPWIRPTDFEVVISPHGTFRVHGPDFDLGRVDREPTPFALKWSAPGFMDQVVLGLRSGARGVRVRLDATAKEE